MLLALWLPEITIRQGQVTLHLHIGAPEFYLNHNTFGRKRTSRPCDTVQLTLGRNGRTVGESLVECLAQFREPLVRPPLNDETNLVVKISSQVPARVD